MKYSTAKKALQGALVIGGVCAVVPIVQVQAQGIGLRKFEEMMTATPSRIERGRKVYAEQCAACHGAQGEGNAPIGAKFDPPARGFTSAEYRFGGGPIAIYNAISSGKMVAEDGTTATHPALFNTLAYQDRWAVAHYVRSLGPTKDLKDPPALVDQAKFEAENGVCNEDIKSTIAAKVQPQGEEQMKKGAEIFAAQCSSCHGATGNGDGPAAAALTPPPRNFHSPDQKWTNGSSQLSIFNTVTLGIAGTSMASYASLSEDERWALVHYVRQWIPEQNLQASTDEQVVEVCRALSTPPKPPAIPTSVAMAALIADAPERRTIEYISYGPVRLAADTDKRAGEQVYNDTCAACHGAMGAGSNQGPFGTFPPYLYIQVNRLIPAMAGGTTDAFAQRSTAGVHTTLPDMTAASQLSTQQWRDLQAYIASFEGDGTVMVDTPVMTDETAAEPTQTPADGQQPPNGQQ